MSALKLDPATTQLSATRLFFLFFFTWETEQSQPKAHSAGYRAVILLSVCFYAVPVSSFVFLIEERLANICLKVHY